MLALFAFCFFIIHDHDPFPPIISIVKTFILFFLKIIVHFSSVYLVFSLNNRSVKSFIQMNRLLSKKLYFIQVRSNKRSRNLTMNGQNRSNNFKLVFSFLKNDAKFYSFTKTIPISNNKILRNNR